MGLHPKSCHYDEAYLDPNRTLVQSNPLVTDLWGIPSDRTVLDYVWNEQERTFPTIRSLLPPRDSLSSSLKRVFKCTFIRRLYTISVKHALETRGYIYIISLGDCHIGFTAKVLPFNNPQTEARKTIPHYRILLETDSSYMPVSLHHGSNTPAYLGDIARIDVHHRSLSMEDLFALTVASYLTSNTYQMVFWRYPLTLFMVIKVCNEI